MVDKVSEQPARTVREGREKFLQAKTIKNMTLYTFKDVQDYAYTHGGLVGWRVLRENVFEITNQQGKQESTAIVVVAAIFSDGTESEALGDANYENTGNSMIGKHFIRMAETRAKGRALAHALNLDANFAEEMGGDDVPARKTSAPNSTAQRANEDPSQFPEQNVDGGWACEETGELLKDTAQSSAGQKALWSSRKNGGRILSYNAQQALVGSRG
jgi:hypothetical protein